MCAADRHAASGDGRGQLLDLVRRDQRQVAGEEEHRVRGRGQQLERVHEPLIPGQPAVVDQADAVL